MRIERRYTKEGQSAYANMTFRHVTSEIRNPDGSVVFKLDNVEVPEFWSQVAADVLVQEYGRYFGMKTACFRGGCLTGPSHSGTQLHGFLAYLVQCAVSN